jgi:hypothetical protein
MTADLTRAQEAALVDLQRGEAAERRSGMILPVHAELEAVGLVDIQRRRDAEGRLIGYVVMLSGRGAEAARDIEARGDA